ncbi:signal recognition particle 9 Srp9 [Encephalitozoon hellem]|uniref:Signal recognition particle 9 Srp9 n=1 Tax=Encephalitozoon hellem TaxID=27973 RepID=A0ABY8CMG7_ENCHE|nr:signal recognition particle 9 Srp9 [Encephalitozoon hellem]
MEEHVYFNDGKTDINKIADKNSNYNKIYMNIKRRGNTTDITLSQGKGGILYILSSVKKEKYSDYFKKKAEDKNTTVGSERKVEELPVSKRTKQSTLFDFIKK